MQTRTGFRRWRFCVVMLLALLVLGSSPLAWAAHNVAVDDGFASFSLQPALNNRLVPLLWVDQLSPSVPSRWPAGAPTTWHRPAYWYAGDAQTVAGPTVTLAVPYYDALYAFSGGVSDGLPPGAYRSAVIVTTQSGQIVATQTAITQPFGGNRSPQSPEQDTVQFTVSLTPGTYDVAVLVEEADVRPMPGHPLPGPDLDTAVATFSLTVTGPGGPPGAGAPCGVTAPWGTTFGVLDPINQGLTQQYTPVTQTPPPDPYGLWSWINYAAWSIQGPGGTWNAVDTNTGAHDDPAWYGGTVADVVDLPTQYYTAGTYTVSVNTYGGYEAVEWETACGPGGCWSYPVYYPVYEWSGLTTRCFTVLPHTIQASLTPNPTERAQVETLTATTAPLATSVTATMPGGLIPVADLNKLRPRVPGANAANYSRRWAGYWVVDVPNGTYTIPVTAVWNTPFGPVSKTADLPLTVAHSRYVVIPNTTGQN